MQCTHKACPRPERVHAEEGFILILHITNEFIEHGPYQRRAEAESVCHTHTQLGAFNA
jgi:hypothetical protein